MRDEVALGVALNAPVLDQILLFLGMIEQQDISYCYWKSSRRLAAALVGDTDLDILVARRDQHRIQRCLLAAGFKLFPSVPHRSDTATVSYLGHDEPSGRIVHVHLHMQLVSGDRLMLDYHLPWEEKVLAWSVPHPSLPIRILDPETEALLLVIRSCLELRRSDPVVARNWTTARQKFEADRQTLLARVNRHTFRLRATELLGEDLAKRVVEVFSSDLPLDRQHSFRRQTRQFLSAYRRFSGFEGRLRGIVRAALWVAGGVNARYLRLPRGWSRQAPGGGLVIALLGVDGSGKSTALAATRRWLGSEVDTMPIYFGTGDGRPSLILLPFKLMVPLFTLLGVSKPKGSSHGNVSDRAPGLIYSVLLTIWSTVLAVEKRKKLLQARRAADRGLVVIADRFPQDQLAAFNDGPLLPRLKWVPQWLRRFEADAYRLARRLPPNLVIKLTATPELIAAREPTMNRDVIRQRVGELAMLTFPDSRVITVDAAQSRDEVMRQIKREVWRQL
jgi:thymidylate kinase